jgi:predicted anti-sigma-YlaC factor YlaD
MTPLDCVREQDVIDAVASGRWPGRAGAELCEHVAGCPVCADLAEVMVAFAAERDQSSTDAAVLPPAEIVWYRAQMRARAEAAQLAGRPMAVVQALAIACAVGAIAAGSETVLTWLQAAFASIPVVAAHLMAAPAGEDIFALTLRGACLAIAISLVLAPVAVYLSAADE